MCWERNQMVAFASTRNTIGRKIAFVEAEILITPDCCKLAVSLCGKKFTTQMRTCQECIDPEKCVKLYVIWLVESESLSVPDQALVYGRVKVVEASRMEL
jgi:hypothetical protein